MADDKKTRDAQIRAQINQKLIESGERERYWYYWNINFYPLINNTQLFIICLEGVLIRLKFPISL